jgi:hypothetical protein
MVPENNQRLLSSFRAFFARGSARDLYELLPSLEAAFQAPPSSDSQSQADENHSLASNYHLPSCEPVPHDHAVPLPIPARIAASDAVRTNRASPYHSSDTPWQPDSEKLDSSKLTADSREAWKFFAARVPTHQRIQNLIRVLDGILKAPKQPQSFYQGLWYANTDHVFRTRPSTESRITRLFHGRRLIDQEHQRFECAGRLSLVFLAHDVEVIKAQDWKLAPGQSRQHAAVMSIAQHLKVEPDEIKKEWRRSRNYVKLLEVCGPGSLLELGTGVNW